MRSSLLPHLHTNLEALTRETYYLLVHSRMDDDLIAIDVDQDPTVVNGIALRSHGQVGVTFQIIPIHIRQGHMGLDKVAALLHGHVFSEMHIGAIPMGIGEKH